MVAIGLRELDYRKVALDFINQNAELFLSRVDHDFMTHIENRNTDLFIPETSVDNNK